MEFELSRESTIHQKRKYIYIKKFLYIRCGIQNGIFWIENFDILILRIVEMCWMWKVGQSNRKRKSNSMLILGYGICAAMQKILFISIFFTIPYSHMCYFNNVQVFSISILYHIAYYYYYCYMERYEQMETKKEPTNNKSKALRMNGLWKFRSSQWYSPFQN